MLGLCYNERMDISTVKDNSNLNVRLESRSPSLLEIQLADYIRLKQHAEDAHRQAEAYRLSCTNLNIVLSALEGSGDREEAALLITSSTAVIPICPDA